MLSLSNTGGKMRYPLLPLNRYSTARDRSPNPPARTDRWPPRRKKLSIPRGFPSPLPGLDGHGIVAPGLAALALGFILSPPLGAWMIRRFEGLSARRFGGLDDSALLTPACFATVERTTAPGSPKMAKAELSGGCALGIGVVVGQFRPAGRIKHLRLVVIVCS